MTPSDHLDRLTHTFSKDRRYFDALFSSAAFVHVCRMFVYRNWASLYFNDFQQSLYDALTIRFPEKTQPKAQYWTLSLTAQIARDVGLVPYLAARGVDQECGTPIRRCLENIGVLSHFWRTPTKAASLGDPEDDDFRKAFVWEPDPQRRRQLRDSGIAKRFVALSEEARKPITSLFEIVSNYCIHGGTPKNLVHTTIEPAPTSCTFLHRMNPDEDNAHRLNVFQAAISITLTEVALLVGAYGNRSRQIREGGAYLKQLITNVDAPSSLMSKELDTLRRKLTG